MKLGIDIGNYQVKTSEGVIFGSKVGNEKIFGSRVPELTIDNKTYYLGEGSLEIEARKFDKSNYLPLLLGAICQSTEADLIDLAVGLPIIQFKNKDIRNELINMINGREFVVKYNSTIRNIVIRKVEVFPEGIAGYLYCRSKGQLDDVGNRDSILIDVGGKTTDIALIQKNKANLPTSVDIGTIDIYYAIAKALREKYYDAKIDNEKIQDYLDQGFYYKGEQQDITFAINKTKELFKQIYDELKINYSIGTEAVVVIGGGAKILGSAFRNNIPGIIIMSNIDADVFANAKGYKMLMK
ncbi:MAG: ParM/StbA family protein [Paraclostridium sp.]